MKLITNCREGEEIEITDNAEFAEFYLFADQLMEIAGITYGTKLDDFDSMYWDFSYKGVGMVLHYNIFLGISIFLRKTANASLEEKNSLRKLSELLIKSFDI